MLNAAANIYKNILQNKILDRKELSHPEYKLVVTGHSLGAGTAAILGFFLRLEKNIKNRVHVYAYGIPGGLLNAPAREESKKFVVSLIHNEDIFPRLSLNSLFNMRNQVRQALYECEEPKCKIISAGYATLLTAMAKYCCCCCCCNIGSKLVLFYVIFYSEET